ncbi:Zinc transporter [Plakobranchus ocellatus]|uniref:Zinc transporter n=1 Tax=Plakobranchus ocellatus TaxID=259542 RepID=A0AAV4CIY3_9GAST|nr:Zinc transporter [Plakobranchus ocellatus]
MLNINDEDSTLVSKGRILNNNSTLLPNTNPKPNLSTPISDPPCMLDLHSRKFEKISGYGSDLDCFSPSEEDFVGSQPYNSGNDRPVHSTTQTRTVAAGLELMTATSVGISESEAAVTTPSLSILPSTSDVRGRRSTELGKPPILSVSHPSQSHFSSTTSSPYSPINTVTEPEVSFVLPYSLSHHESRPRLADGEFLASGASTADASTGATPVTSASYDVTLSQNDNLRHPTQDIVFPDKEKREDTYRENRNALKHSSSENHSRSDNSVKRVNTTTKHSNCSTVIDSRDTDTLDLPGFAVNKSNREAFSPPQPHRQYPWKKNRYRGFSPLPTASSSTEEEEDETEEGEMQNESAEGSNKEGDREGTARASNSKRRRRWQKLKSLPLRHCHKRRLSPMTDPIARRQLIAVVVLCLVFMVGEAVGGALANSLALFTDVLHLGSDLVSFVISLLAMWLANKPATRRMSFGYHRAEVLGALLSVFIIWLVSGVLCYIAVERIMEEHYKDVKPNEMLITASLGVVINFIMGFVLHSEICCGHAHSHARLGHGHSHGHSHGQNHGSTSAAANPGYNYAEDTGLLDTLSPSSDVAYEFMEGTIESHQLVNVVADERHDGEEEEETPHQHKNINVRAAFIHVVGDIIQSIGVLVAALIIKFTEDPRFRLADPICTFLFSLLVLVTTVTVLRDTLLVMMEAVPRDLSLEGLKQDLRSIDGVVALHDLHVWALTLDRNALSVHLAIENPNAHVQVLSRALTVAQDQHGFFSSTIQVEMFDEEKARECSECSKP